MTARRPAGVRPAARPHADCGSVPTSVWLQPITYVMVFAALGAAAGLKAAVLAMASVLHLT